MPGGPIGGTSGPAKALATRQRLKNKTLHIVVDLSGNLYRVVRIYSSSQSKQQTVELELEIYPHGRETS
jgi:hypothetical protein